MNKEKKEKSCHQNPKPPPMMLILKIKRTTPYYNVQTKGKKYSSNSV